jgi:hypothetical protein
MNATDRTEEIEAFLANEPGGMMPEPLNPEAPRVVFPGLLTLTRQQEEALTERCFQRKDNLEMELGLDRARLSDTDYFGSASLEDLQYFFGRRRLFELVYHRRVDWRPFAYGKDSIFAKTNLHVPVIRRILQQQIARASNYFFATEPWFNASPQGLADEQSAKQINRFAQWKFRRGGVRPVLEQAIEKAFIRGECVVKTTAIRNSRFYEDEIEVLIDPATGEPLTASDGDYIRRDDTWEPVMVEQPDPETGEVMAVPEELDGEPVMVLSRDPKTQHPGGDLVFEMRRVRRERVMYSGPEASIVHYLDFLCPESAKSVQDADFVCHTYDAPASQITQAYLNAGPDVPPEQRQRMLDLIRRVAQGNNVDPAAESGVRPEDGGQVANEAYHDTRLAGRVPLIECYVTMDVNGDGQPEEVMAVFDRQTRQPIFYDYLDRVTRDGKRPFHVIRVNPVDGRWYGGSQVDLFWDIQMFIDLSACRWNFSQTGAARVDFWNPEAIEGGEAMTALMLNSGRSHRLKKGYTADDALQSKYLTDVKGPDLQNQIEFFMQIATTMSGVASANDAAVANLDTTKLATGVRNIEKGGQELFAPLISHLQPGLESACESLLSLLVWAMEGPEVYQYFEGETRVEEIRPDDIRALAFIVEMELTRYKAEQEVEQAMASINVMDRFYSLPPQLQQIEAPLYQNLMKRFGNDHADRLIVAGLYSPPPPGGVDPEAASAAVQPKPDGKSPPNL